MSFLRVDETHLQVPGKMQMDEMAYLAALAAMVPNSGHIVEIGPFYGRSTCTIGRANPDAKITSIDPFEDVEWTRRYAAQHKGVPAFGLSAFESYTRALKNARTLVGASPDIAAGWTEPIDMFFEDAVHGNPVLGRNLEFWTRHLKPGGIACGHDYALRFPDVKREVDALAQRWKTRVSVVGSLWALRKPHGKANAPPLDPALSLQPHLTLQTKNKRFGRDQAKDGYWCGAHLDADRLYWVQIDTQGRGGDLALEVRVAHPLHGCSPWRPAGERVMLLSPDGRAKPFDRLAIRLRGPASEGLHVGYRVSARQIGNGGSAVSGQSAIHYDGDWTQTRAPGLAVNALSVALYDTPPPAPQVSFPRAGVIPKAARTVKRLIHRTSRPPDAPGSTRGDATQTTAPNHE